MGGCAPASVATRLAPLLADTRHVLRASAAAACGRLGLAGLAPEVAALLGDRSPAVRVAALEALPALGKEHLDQILERLTDRAPEVRAAAVTAIAATDGGEVYAGVLAQLLQREAEQATPLVRVACVDALGRLGERGALYTDVVAELLEDPSFEVRAVANRHLGYGSGDPRALQAEGSPEE